MDQDGQVEGSMASDMEEIIQGRFGTSTERVALRDFANLYSVMAAQQEALLSVYALAMKMNPQLIFTDEAVSAQRKIQKSADKFGEMLMALDAVYPGDEEGDE